jgi:hypothetical protein
MGEANKPARDYKMVDVQNGLTYKLLEIGTTSLTFAVEWPLDMDIPSRQLNLYGKFHMDSEWSGQLTMEIDPASGEAIFEIKYESFPWYYPEPEKTKFEQKAFFCFAPTPPDGMGWDGTWPDDEGEEKPPSRNNLWLYLAILPLALAVFYFLRRKLKTGN